MNQSSLEAFLKYKDTWGQQHRQICETLAVYGDMTTEQIGLFLRKEQHEFSGRITELKDAGIIKSRGKVLNRNNIRVNLWGV